MPSDSLFKSLARRDGATVRIVIDGTPYDAPAGVNVAAAMLAAGDTVCRTTPVTGAPRAPYCLMGVCFDCLVEIDGVPNRQGCMTPVRDGMRVRRMQGARELA
ncbi:(2Fe-2S)-binding protein [Pandoraea norimbergensis]|uniref:Sarcosine oxidase subunit alpha n=1 Tax=Pandoraea norimbergensis TaxID=93219 RepID=A0ABM5WQ46_9BURK|nr:(2Fe-2S)-binding protein [Pandoraea norimbergensis]ALS62767.1 sarcosine oxidase subunit alpha [Pandoraea norimbergensis]